MPILALLYLIAASPIASAQGVFDMGSLTNTMAQGAIVQSERKRAIRMGKGDPLGKGGSGGKRARPASKAALLYTPSLAARKRNLEAFANKIGAVDPTGAKSLRQSFANGDVIAQAGKIMRTIGLNPNNVADTMAVYLVTAWHGVRGSVDSKPGQFRTVSAQLSRVAATNPAMTRATNAVKQETAESMMLSALLVDASVTDAKKSPAKMPGVRDAVAKGARTTFGFDLAKLRLGANGLY